MEPSLEDSHHDSSVLQTIEVNRSQTEQEQQSSTEDQEKFVRMNQALRAMNQSSVSEIETLTNLTLEDIKKYATLNDDTNQPYSCECCRKEIRSAVDPSKKVLRCKGCYLVVYCSLECQRKDWTTNNEASVVGYHRIVCKKVSKYLHPAPLNNRTEPGFVVETKSEIWKRKLSASRDYMRGELIAEHVPLFGVFNFSGSLEPEKLSAQQMSLLTGDHFSKNQPSENETTTTLLVSAHDVEVFGKDFPSKSLTTKNTFLLLKTHLEIVKCSFFENGCSMTEFEKKEVDQLFEYISKNRHLVMTKQDPSPLYSNTITKDDVTAAYITIRQNVVHGFELFQNNKPLVQAFVPTLACANHSCNPNTFVFWSSGVFCMYATKDISKGDQLFFDYLNNKSAVTSYDLRRRLLKSRFNFICKCKRCEKETLDDSIPKKPTFTAPKNNNITAQEKEATLSKNKKDESSKQEIKDPNESTSTTQQQQTKKFFNPYASENIPESFRNNQLSKLSHSKAMEPGNVEKLTDYIREMIFFELKDFDETKKTTEFLEYLFDNDWPTLHHLIYDVLHEEVTNQNLCSSTNKDQDKNDSRRAKYRQFLLLFLKHPLNEHHKENVDSTHFFVIVHWCVFILTIGPYLREYTEMMKDCIGDSEDQNRMLISRLVKFYDEILSGDDRMIIQRTLFFFSFHFYQLDALKNPLSSNPHFGYRPEAFVKLFNTDVFSEPHIFLNFVNCANLLSNLLVAKTKELEDAEHKKIVGAVVNNNVNANVVKSIQ